MMSQKVQKTRNDSDNKDVTSLKELKNHLISTQLDSTALQSQYHQIYSALSLTDAIEVTVAKFDLISIILLKLTKLKTPVVHVDLQLIQYVYVNLDRTNKSSMNYAVNNLTNKLVEYMKLTDSYEDTIMDWLDHLIQWFNNSKQLLGLIENLLKHLHHSMSRFYRTQFSFIVTLWNNFKSDSLANSSNKVLMVIYKRLFEQLGSGHQWFELWDQLLYDHLMDEMFTKNILIYCIPRLFEIDISCLQSFLDKHFQQEINYHFSTESKFNLYINILKVSQDLSASQDNIPPDFFSKSLTNHKITIRISALNLLCYSQKSSKPISKKTYDLLRQNLRHIIMDIDTIGLRNELINILNAFVIRIRDSNYNLFKQSKTSQLSEGIEFLKWLVSYLVEILTPAYMYSQQCMGLAILNKLIDLNLDSFHPPHKEKSNNPKFPFSVEIFSPPLITNLFNNINNDFEDIRIQSAQMLFKCPLQMMDTITSNHDYFISRSIDLCLNLNSRKSEGGSYCFQVLAFHYFHTLKQPEVVYDMLNYLMEFMKNAKTLSIVENTVEKSSGVHGVASALKLIIEVLPAEFFSTNHEFFIPYFAEILDTNKCVWKSIKPVIATQELEDSSDAQDGEDDKQIVTFSWKYIKESTGLINVILDLNHSQWDFVSPQVFLDYLDLLVEQISVIKHKGAFSSIYPCFISISNFCFTNKELQGYPKQLLHNNLNLIENKFQLITRRSGGLPYLITGILTSYKIAHGNSNDIAKETFDFLFRIIADSEKIRSDKDNTFDLPQVNALNCLKSIVNDSQLTHETSGFITPCLKVCFTHFHNKNWSIKNSALMLFTSLKNKLISSKTKLLSVGFFKDSENSALFDECLNSHNSEMIFAVLSILSNLNFVNDEARLLHYKAILVEVLLRNKNWKIREMTARTVGEIILASQYDCTIFELTDMLSECCADGADYNYKHGLFLSILEVTNKIHQTSTVSSAVSERILSLNKLFDWSNFKVYIELLKYVTVPRDIYTQLSEIFTSHLDIIFDGLKQLAMNKLLQFLIEYEILNDNDENLIELIELCIGLNLDFTIIAADALRAKNIPIDMNIIWNRLSESDLPILTLRYLDVLAKYPAKSKESMPNVNILKSLINNSQEEISSKALHVLSVHDPNAVEEYLDIVWVPKDDFSELVRKNYLMVTINILENMSSKTSIEPWFSMFYFLTDNSEDVRTVAASFVARKFGCEYTKPSYILIDDFKRFLLENFDHMTIQLGVVNNFPFSSAWKQYSIAKTSSSEPIEDLWSLYESPSSYRNMVEVSKAFINLLESTKLNKDTHMVLCTNLNQEIDSLLEFLNTFAYDGPMGYTRFNRIFQSMSILSLTLQYLYSLPADLLPEQPDMTSNHETLKKSFEKLQIHPMIQTLLH